MSKSKTKHEVACDIYQANLGMTRKDTIAIIVQVQGVSDAYASTLYAGAKKAFAAAVALPAPAKAAKREPKPKGAGVTRFTKPVLKELRGDLDAALTACLEKHGLRGEIGNISFGELRFSTKLTVHVAATDKQGFDIAAKANWDLHCWRRNLTEEMFGMTFISRGAVFTVSGYNHRAKKYPISAIRKDNGSEYAFTEAPLLRAVAAAND